MGLNPRRVAAERNRALEIAGGIVTRISPRRVFIRPVA
jgi:hypothetical protein